MRHLRYNLYYFSYVIAQCRLQRKRFLNFSSAPIADHYVNQKAQKKIPLPPGRGITPYRITQSASTSAMKA